MRMLGFTAEASLYEMSRGYQMAGSPAPLAKSGEVLPQAVINNHCIWLNGYGYYLCCFCGDTGCYCFKVFGHH